MVIRWKLTWQGLGGKVKKYIIGAEFMRRVIGDRSEDSSRNGLSRAFQARQEAFVVFLVQAEARGGF